MEDLSHVDTEIEIEELFSKEEEEKKVLFLVTRHFCKVLFSEIRTIGLYDGQPICLGVLKNFNGCMQKEIAKQLHVKPATISVMVKRMENSGLVKRVADEEDKRIYRIFITEKRRKSLSKSKRDYE